MEIDTKDMHANGTIYIKIPYALAVAFRFKKNKRTKLKIDYDPYYDEEGFKVRRAEKDE